MTLNSQSNGSRTRTVQYQLPASSFNDKLMQAVREEKEEQAARSSPHPNLDMFLSADKISMMDTKASKDFSFSEDEESDEGEFFSSSLCPMSSPERPITKRSIFDDDSMSFSPPPPSNGFKRSIFDEDDDEEEEEQDNQIQMDKEYGDFYDPSSAWLNCIYEDNGTQANNVFQDKVNEAYQEEEEVDDEENRAPRFWHARKQYEKKIRRTSPQEEENAVHDRIPLRQINVEDYYSDNEDLPVKKKIVLANKKAQAIRSMRALSPPRYMSKLKGKEALSSSSSYSSSSSSSSSSASSSTSYL